MGIFALLGLLTIGLIAGAFSGGDDSAGGDSGENETPDPAETNQIVQGTSADDDIAGARGDDLVFGRGGEDTINGGAGDDLLLGGVDDDLIRGGNGADTLAGGRGDDTLNGWLGNDLLLGGNGNDSISGGDGDDRLLGISGANTLDGGAGDDVVDGRDVGLEYGFDAAERAALAELLEDRHGDDLTPDLRDRALDALDSRGAPGADLLLGGDGADTLLGDAGDSMAGGAGTDQFSVTYDADRYEDFGRPVIRDFDPETEELRLDLPEDVLRGPVLFEQQGASTRVLVADLHVVTLSGVAPDALADARITVTGGMIPDGPGALILAEGTSDTALTGTGANDMILGSATGATTLAGGFGDDVIHAVAPATLVDGGAGNDLIIGSECTHTLSGGLGDDLILGDAGRMAGNAGNDTLIGIGTGAHMFGGDGNDVLIGYDNLAGVRAGHLGDTLRTVPDAVEARYTTGTTEALVARATGVLATVAAETGAERLSGGAGNDTLWGDNGDVLTGGAGEDVFRVFAPPASAAERLTMITDFNAAEDRIEVEIDGPVPLDPVTVSGPLDAQVLSLLGVPFAVVQGASAAIDPATIRIIGEAA